MVYFITGRKDSGKTTYAMNLAKRLRQEGKAVYVLDGDEVRDLIPADFDEEGRRKHILRISKFAKIAERQGIIVIIALMSPRKRWREEARDMFKESQLVYMLGGTLWPDTLYEEPDEGELGGEGTPGENCIVSEIRKGM